MYLEFGYIPTILIPDYFYVLFEGFIGDLVTNNEVQIQIRQEIEPHTVEDRRRKHYGIKKSICFRHSRVQFNLFWIDLQCFNSFTKPVHSRSCPRP